ncbi:hypothetical protein XENORESO_018402 [Xenotaenia resolanae]|uniref:Uncharacterized protein n=1 Tax=Xenotaenia resolanae TaxID=208358 RepID=A0ABV0VZH8_9TELE
MSINPLSFLSPNIYSVSVHPLLSTSQQSSCSLRSSHSPAVSIPFTRASYPPASFSLSSSAAHLCMYKPWLTFPAALKSREEEEEALTGRGKTLKDLNRISEESRKCSEFHTTGNKKKPCFDALTVDKGEECKWRKMKTFLCPALSSQH